MLLAPFQHQGAWSPNHDNVLCGQDSENVTANIIHDALYAANPATNAVIHLHTPATVAVSCLEEGFLFLEQNSVSCPP